LTQPHRLTYTERVTRFPSPAQDSFQARTVPLSVDGLKALGTGFLLAVIVSAIPPLRFILHYLNTLIHELGHTVFFWLFGYPAFPAFDFSYGGGLSFHHGRSAILLFLIAAVYVGAGYGLRSFRRLLGALTILAVLHLILSLSRFHDALILFMGHGTEILFGSLFLYRALSGSGIKVPLERPLYGMCGWFLYIQNFIFAHDLINSEQFRDYYENAAKGGGHWMDFSQLAEIYLRVDLSVVAQLFFFYSVLTLGFTWAFYRYRAWIKQFGLWLIES